MKRLLREPLVHFLLGGLALFVLYGAVGDFESERRERITVSAERVAALAQTFERTWLREPSPDELAGLIDDFVIEEILYREALALGLDRDDLIVRRRMRQKLEFLNEDLAEVEPTEAALGSFLAENRERFRIPMRQSFEQVFVSAEAAGPADARAAAVLAALRAGEADGAAGDPTLLPRTLSDASPDEIARSFGAEFAEAVAGLPLSEWSGPVASSFGLHLVRVRARAPARDPELAELRALVEREWAAEQRASAQQRFYRALRERYDVEVEPPGRAS